MAGSAALTAWRSLPSRAASNAFMPRDPVAPANTTNWHSSTQFPNFRKAKQAVFAGTGRAIVGICGDSTSAGVGAGGTGGGPTNCTNLPYRNIGSYSFELATALGALGTFDNFIGSGNDLVTLDSRMTLSGGAAESGAAAWGGPCYNLTSSGGTMAFAPTSGLNFDTIRVVIIASGAGQFNVNINGGATVGSGTSNASGNMQAFTFSVTRGTTTPVNIVQSGSTAVFLQSVECYDSLNPRINILDGGSGGLISTSFDSSSTGFTYNSGCLACTPHLIIFDVGINDDQNGSPTVAQYYTNVSFFCNLMKSHNIDLLGMVPTPINNTGSQWFEFRAQLQSLSNLYNFPLIDLHSRYVSYNQQSTNKSPGWFCNNLHPDALLYTDLGTFLANVLLSI